MVEVKELDRDNKNTLWQDTICKEMENVRISFEEHNGNIRSLPNGYQKIDCHMVFDVKMGKNFKRKARIIAGGHKTETPVTLTYSLVISRDSVRICLLIAALNGLDIMTNKTHILQHLVVKTYGQ